MASETRKYTVQVLGRLLELLGLQMYKNRDVAIVELVANAWDAGATRVDILLPDPNAYSRAASSIRIADNGIGMSPDDVGDAYLIVGRNRRTSGGPPPHGRLVMGRKGIGKLAGFGIAGKMEVETVKDGKRTAFALSAAELKASAGKPKSIEVVGTISPAGGVNSTTVVLRELKHETPMNPSALIEAIGRRMSRTVRGLMEIYVNGTLVGDPSIDFDDGYPSSPNDVHEETLPSGVSVRYSYGFSKTVLRKELQGWTVLVHGKTAEAPPFFFGVESRASGQHGTKYLTGYVEADFLDDAEDDESDAVSTDRQQIDWEIPAAAQLKAWGDAKTRQLLIEWANRGSDRAVAAVQDDAPLSERMQRLPAASRKEFLALVRKIGSATSDQSHQVALADTLLRAYEYEHFHAALEKINQVSEDADALVTMLTHLGEWKAIEGRALLEIVKGRASIVDTLAAMVANDAPETAPRIGVANLHDLLGQSPWILEPKFQLVEEERSVSKLVREMAEEEGVAVPEGAERNGERLDFLALSGSGQLVVIEIKRPDHAPTFEELQRLQRYLRNVRLANEHTKAVLICGLPPSVEPQDLGAFSAAGISILRWAEVVEECSKHYRAFRAVLEAETNHAAFQRAAQEVIVSRRVAAQGAYRSPEERQLGLGMVGAASKKPPSKTTSARAKARRKK